MSIYVIEIPAEDDINDLTNGQLVEKYPSVASGETYDTVLNGLVWAINNDRVDDINNMLQVVELKD